MIDAVFREGRRSPQKKGWVQHGWEHEHPTPIETREALAAAAAADAAVLGAKQVTVLAVSHTDCEDLTDRIRAVRADLGELGGPTLSGPGWGSDARTYATGDRVLLHATVATGAVRLHNGATGTVSHVREEGLLVRFDDGRLRLLAREFAKGRRPNGDPNLSHAWARTVDGAQGGTWAQVHLLGTSALDRFRGYVGQSRGQFPTHTWNTKRVAEHDHGAVVDERRSAAEEVLAAMGREPLKTFAAGDDPWVLHRQLTAERDTHYAELEAAPPYVEPRLVEARDELARAMDRQTLLASKLQRTRAEVEDISPWARLRRSARDARAAAEARTARVDDDLLRTEEAAARAGARLDQLQLADEQSVAFEAEHGWRRERIAAINDRLDHHWARTALSTVREDDPLAFGIDELRRARQTYAADRDAVLRTIPSDRSGALRDTQNDAQRAEEVLRFAARQTTRRTQELHEAEQHPVRRHKTAIAEASSKLSDAEADLAKARDQGTRVRDQLAVEHAAEVARRRALEATKDERSELRRALREIDVALEDTRIERVLALAQDDSPPFYVLEALRELPQSRGGQRAWCGLAAEIERYRDLHGLTNEALALGPEPQFRPGQVSDKERNRVHDLVERADAIIGAAHELDPVRRHSVDATDSRTWVAQVAAAEQRMVALCEVARPEIGREAEADLGLSW